MKGSARSRQTVTAKETPGEGESVIDLGDVPVAATIYFAFEDGRSGDVVLVDATGGELLIGQDYGPGGHYTSHDTTAAKAPFLLKATTETDVDVTLSVIREE